MTGKPDHPLEEILEELDILPPLEPGGKWRLSAVRRRPGVPLIRPPVRCCLCNTEREGHHFPHDVKPDEAICFGCLHHWRFRRHHGMSWDDNAWFNKVHVALRALDGAACGTWPEQWVRFDD